MSFVISPEACCPLSYKNVDGVVHRYNLTKMKASPDLLSSVLLVFGSGAPGVMAHRNFRTIGLLPFRCCKTTNDM